MGMAMESRRYLVTMGSDRRWCRPGTLVCILLAVTCCGALPTFLSPSYSTAVSELTPTGSILINVTATPATPGNTLTYNIFSHPPILDIDSTTGSVVLVGSLDYEQETSHTFNVEVFEGLDAIMTSVTINVENANDEVPLCSKALYTVTVPESSAVGTDLLSLSCSDSDGDSLLYSLEGDSADVFQLTQIDALTTSLSLAVPVDSDALSTLSLLVDVFDGQHTAQLALFVYLEPSNDHVPTFNQSIYDCSISESASIGSVFCSVTAADEDSGPDGEISYSITGGNDANKFGINSQTGEIVIVGHIDYESVQGHLIFVRARDNGESPLSNAVQVRITVVDTNDNAPLISPLITGIIAENSPLGSVVKVLECSDADSGSNGDIELTIDSQADDEGADVAVFSIESSTNELVTDSSIDYEQSLSYTISLFCRDNGFPSLTSSSTVIVNVSPQNEFAPMLTSDSYSATISENSTVGTRVLQVAAVDSDGGSDGSVEFSIEAEGRDLLQISETSGHVITRELLDCNWGEEHVFIITATDGGTPPLSGQSQLTVRLEHCRLGQLVPQETIYFASVTENSPENTKVVVVPCDTDRLGDLEYSILSPSASPFLMDSASGHISIATPPDYEQATSHMLQVKCADPSNRESYATFSVYVTVSPENEHSPEFSLSVYEAELSEDAEPGSSVVGVEAVDGDSGIDGSVVYSIQEDTQTFVVDSRTGVVYNTIVLDREKESLHSFHIVAMDQEGQGESVRSSVAEIRVNVADSNDNTPECDRLVFHLTLSPLLEAGEKILSLDCRDADIGPNSELQYSLHSQSSESLEQFSISEGTGELVLARKFSPESAAVHEMTVTIEDRGEPSRSTVALVVVGLESSPVTADGGGTAAEAEGSRNIATFTMRDMSFKLWAGGGKESFQEAMAHSVTSHCGLLPETCSMLSGCAHFYSRRKRTANEYFITIFTDDNVVLVREMIPEFTGPDGTTYLNITFYITLPEGTQKSDYRTTDYVVPGTTLSLLVRDEGPAIESQVRGKVAPPLTQRSSTSESHSLDWVWGMMGTFAVVVACVFIALLARFSIQKWNYSKKRAVAIAPLVSTKHRWKSPQSMAAPSDPSGVNPSGNVKKKRLLLRDLVTDEVGWRQAGRLTPESEQDDISTIELAGEDSNECSLQGQPRSQGSPALSSAVSGYTARNSQKSGSKSSSVGDYKQNFPYEPPRQHHTQPNSRPRPVAQTFGKPPN